MSLIQLKHAGDAKHLIPFGSSLIVKHSKTSSGITGVLQVLQNLSALKMLSSLLEVVFTIVKSNHINSLKICI